MTVKIKVNGNEENLEQALTIAEHMQKRDAPAGVIVALNGEVVDRERWGEVTLQNGDALEIIRIVGGG